MTLYNFCIPGVSVPCSVCSIVSFRVLHTELVSKADSIVGFFSMISTVSDSHSLVLCIVRVLFQPVAALCFFRLVVSSPPFLGILLLGFFPPPKRRLGLSKKVLKVLGSQGVLKLQYLKLFAGIFLYIKVD